MSIEINLISKPTDGLKDIRLEKIKTISFVILFFIAILSLILFLIDYRFSASYVRKEQNKLIEKLSAYDETASKIYLRNSRFSDISDLLSTRKKYHEKAEKIIEKVPPEVATQEFKIDDSGIAMAVISSSLLELNNFLNELLSLSKSKVLGGVVLDGLSVGASGYTMKIKAN